MRCLLIATMFAAATVAADAPALKADLAWARATAPGAANGGVFVTISNSGKLGDRLLRAGSDRAHAVELHAHIMDDGVARMTAIPDIAVPAGKTVELKPGGWHVMLIGLVRPLLEGEKFPLTLQFESAGTQIVEVDVLGAGAGAVSAGHANPHGRH